MGPKDRVELPCPGGGSPLRTTYADICSRSSLRTGKGEYRFKSSDQYRLKSAFSDLDRLQKRFEQEFERAEQKVAEAFESLVKNAEKVVK